MKSNSEESLRQQWRSNSEMMRKREEVKKNNKQLKLLDRVSQSHGLHSLPSLAPLRQ